MPVKLPGLHTTLQRSTQRGSSGLQIRRRLRLNMPTLIQRALRSTAWQSRCDVRTRTFVVKCLSVTTRVNFALMWLKAWVEYYKGLLDVKFTWDEGALPDAPPVEGPPPPITDEMVTKVVAKVNSGVFAGPSGIIVEMLKAAGSKGIDFLCELIISVVKHGKIPEDWEMRFILNLYKCKGDALNRGHYRGLKLTNTRWKSWRELWMGWSGRW